MDDLELVEPLNSRMPTTRMRAAHQILNLPPRPALRRLLVEAGNRETVPQIKQVLQAALSRLDEMHSDGVVASGSEPELNESLLRLDLAAVLEHEFKPGIGLIRFEANQEIPGFQDSRTNRAIEILRGRMEGLVRLVEAYTLPNREPFGLYEFLTSVARSVDSGALLIHVDENEYEDIISSDRGLLQLIMENAFRNALEASAVTEITNAPNGEHHLQQGVAVSWGVSDRAFWVTASNRFSGASFAYEDISASGRSSKFSHAGLGTRIMGLAASRLGYRISLSGAGGQAIFSLRGGRYV